MVQGYAINEKREQNPLGCDRKKVLTPTELRHRVGYFFEENPKSISRDGNGRLSHLILTLLLLKNGYKN